MCLPSRAQPSGSPSQVKRPSDTDDPLAPVGRDGLEHILLLLTTPIDDVTSCFTFVLWRNDDFSVSADEVVAFDRLIGMEDKAMLERIPGVLSLNVAAAVSVQADRPSLAWRRQFVALLQDAAQREGFKGGKPHIHGPSTQTCRANQPL